MAQQDQNVTEAARAKAQETADQYAKEIAEMEERRQSNSPTVEAQSGPKAAVGDSYFSVEELTTGTEEGWHEALVELVGGKGEKTVCYLPVPMDVVDKVNDLVADEEGSAEEKQAQNSRRLHRMAEVAAGAILNPETHKPLFESAEEMKKVVPLYIVVKFFEIATTGIAGDGQEKKDSGLGITSSIGSADTTGLPM